MVVSKAHDETSRSTASHDDEATPAPTAEDIQSAKLAVTAAAVRRPRVGSAVARERSGPIGIASGDFSTPSVRRRTITQPRGTPAAGIPLSMPMATMAEPEAAEPEAAEPEAVVPEAAAREVAPPRPPTPPPLPAEPPPLGATPVDLVDGGISGQASGAPPPIDSPFGATPVDGEASALAAEAAAVRALDSGPLTPPPEVAYAGPTPPPEPKAAPPPEPTQAPPAPSSRRCNRPRLRWSPRPSRHRRFRSQTRPRPRTQPTLISKARFRCGPWGATAAPPLPIWRTRSKRRPRRPPARTTSICREPTSWRSRRAPRRAWWPSPRRRRRRLRVPP